MSDEKNVLKAFEAEISWLSDKILRERAKDILEYYGNRFYKQSASRYHPKDEHNDRGFILHCRRVAFWSVEFCKELNLNDDIRDSMIFSAMFHDIGRVLGGQWYDHGNRSVQMMYKANPPIKKIKQKKLDMIKALCRTHMHHWDRQAPQPQTLEQHVFALADYTASRAFIKTPTLKVRK